MESVLPLRDIVVFPHMIAPLFVGRKKSILALEEVMRSDTFILLATQKNASDDEPATEAIHEIGTLASVLQLLKLPGGIVVARHASVCCCSTAQHGWNPHQQRLQPKKPPDSAK